MRLPVRVEPLAGMTPDIDYRWDPDTDILSARVRAPEAAERVLALPTADERGDLEDPVARTLRFGPDDALTGIVELEGRDGSWIVLDVERGRLAGVEVAIWPNDRRRRELAPPADVEDALVRLPGRRRGLAPGAHPTSPLEVPTHVTAESDPGERIIHFRLGPVRAARSVRLGRDLLVDVDAQGHLAGLWLLNVPPVPTVT